jgi:tetratricopeptide (TPR) repeat protein
MGPLFQFEFKITHLGQTLNMADITAEVITPANAEKNLGNDAFAKKDYTKAIEHYQKAIDLDENNPFYYSNLSACYASLKRWEEAMQAAMTCVSKDDKFVKGYLRLAAAQSELNKYDDAETTLRAALTLEPQNTLVGQQLKKLKEKKQAILAAAAKPKRQLDEQQRKEIFELQEQTGSYQRDLRTVIQRINGLSREAAATDNTQKQMGELKDETELYRGIGKAYVLQSRSVIDDCLTRELDTIDKNYKDLKDRKEYLERRITSNQSNLKDLTVGL